MQEQIRGFQIGAFFRQVFDGIAAITEDAGVAIDVRNPADARSGVVERRVVAHQAKIFWIHFNLAEVGGADGVVRDGDFVGLPSTIVDDGEGLAGRGGALFLSRCRCGEWGVHSNSSNSAEQLPGFPLHFTPNGALPETAPGAPSA